jgi:hypothetical protein
MLSNHIVDFIGDIIVKLWSFYVLLKYRINVFSGLVSELVVAEHVDGILKQTNWVDYFNIVLHHLFYVVDCSLIRKRIYQLTDFLK